MKQGDSATKLVRHIDAAVTALRSGGVIAFPTDTVYGLGADALNGRAVEKIYHIKNRPLNLALPILVAGKEALKSIVSRVPVCASILIDSFWPGALTLVMSRLPSFPASSGLPTIAVRMPDHPIALALIKGLGSPLTGTSANLSGRPSTLTATEVKNQLGNTVDYIVDGGRCPGGVESTVVDVTGVQPVIVRLGAIPEKVIFAALEKNKASGVVSCV